MKMSEAYLYIAIAVAFISLIVCLRVIVLYFWQIKNSDTITFVKGNRRVTVSKNYTREDSEKLMQL